MVLATFFLLFFAFLYTLDMQYSVLPMSDLSDYGFSFWQSKSWAKILQESHQVEEVFYFGNLEYGFLLIEIRSIGA
jgi:hypothetical protein